MQLSAAHFLETADFIGAKLSRDAIWCGQRCNWFGVPVSETKRSIVVEAQSVCGSDFYSGTSGIAVFLACLFAATGEKIFRITAEGAIRQALSRVDHFPRGSRIDFYSGLTGVAYSLFVVAENCGIDKFKHMGLLILEEISGDDIPVGSLSDVCSAVTLDALVRMYQRHQRDFLLRFAVRYGEDLLKQLPDPEGSSREQSSENDVESQLRALSIASSLLGLFTVTNHEKYRQTAERVFNERARHNECHESNAAIERASLRALEIFPDDVYFTHACERIQLIQSGIESRTAEDVDLSLGRGLTCEADLLIESSRVLGNEQFRRAAEKVGNWAIERYRNEDLPWPCGSANGWDVPSLMIGLAGIGYFYLRLYDSRVPSLP